MVNILLNKWTMIGLLILAVLFLFKRNISLSDQVKTSEHNYQVMLKDSESVVIATKKQMKQAIESDDLTIRILRDSLKLKTKDVQGIVKGGSKTVIRFKTVLRDSIVYNVIDSVAAVHKSFVYNDDYNNVKGLISNDSVNLTINTKDSLFVVTSNYKDRKFFMARWFEKPKTKVQITGSNPNSSYTVNRVFQKSD